MIIFLEIFWTRIQLFFGKKLDESVIPEGFYCYKYNGKDGFNEDELPYHGIDACPYFRKFKNGNTACLFIGYYGFDFAHYDQCKICDVNKNYENE
jgi:hypothetical protein